MSGVLDVIPGSAPHAVRWTQSDEQGRFRVRGIDAGIAALAVRHPTHVCIDSDLSITCTLPAHDLALEFAPIHVAAVEMPPVLGEVLNHQSRRGSGYSGPATASALQDVRRWLAERYPEAIRITAAPKDVPPEPVRLRILMESGWYEFSAELEPLEDWGGPKRLSKADLPEPRRVRLAEVRARFLHPDGTTLPMEHVGEVSYWGGTRGMPTLVEDVAERKLLPFGDYRLRCRDRVLAESIDDVAITIDDPEETLDIHLEPGIAHCTVNVIDESGRSVSYFLLQITYAGKLVQQLSVRGGSTACWLPVGSMDAQVRSLGYVEEPHPIVVDNAGSDLTIQLRRDDA